MLDSTMIKKPLHMRNAEMTEEYKAKYMRTSLQQHCAFFDLDRDGVLSLTDTFAGMRLLGFNWLTAGLFTLLIHLAFSYPSSTSWFPSATLAIELKNIEKCRHGSTSRAYAHLGDLQCAPPQLLSFLRAYDRQDKGGLSAWELCTMVWSMRAAYDWFGWLASWMWWSLLFWLAADRSTYILSMEAIASQFDGTLFYYLADRNQNKPNKQ